MAKLAYYADRIAPDKPHQLETAEGYRIYTAVPICRTGFQEYLGKELKSHPDYQAAWNLKDDELVKVFRPAEVVTAPETVASFEGKSVLDGHPPADVSIVTVETDGEYGRGHTQNVRVGNAFDDGAIPLLADLFVKDQPLNDKIDGGVRDVSCGYIYNMKRADDGTLFMTRICGNHVAVVPNGRAGPEVSIRDSAPDLSERIRIKPEIEKGGPMADQKKEHFWGRMLKLLSASDAAPEDIEKIAKAAKDEEESEAEAKREEEKKAKDKAAKDAEEEAAKKKEGEGEVTLHPKLQEAVDHIAHMRSAVDAITEHLGVGKKKEEEAAGDADVLEMTGAEKGKTDLATGDSGELVRLRGIRADVAETNNPILIADFNARVKAAKSSATDSNAYADLAKPANPNAGEAIESIDPMQFFNGVPYAEGVRRFTEHQKSTKGGK